MPGWAITPVGAYPPQSGPGMPNFMQWQADGVDLGGPDVQTVNLRGTLRATRGVGEQAATLDISTASAVAWRAIGGDGVLQASDIGNGVAMRASTGAPNLVIPEGLIAPGESVLVFNEGAALATITASGGDELLVRDGFLAALAGQYAIVTLIGAPEAGQIILCGDMRLA